MLSLPSMFSPQLNTALLKLKLEVVKWFNVYSEMQKGVELYMEYEKRTRSRILYRQTVTYVVKKMVRSCIIFKKLSTR